MVNLIHQIRLFFIALQFFTRIPIPSWVGFEPDWLQHASRYFVLVGVCVGAVCCCVYFCAAIFFPQALAVVLSGVAGIYLTGAFHEDGFADMCDGFGGGNSTERILDIMRDSRIGAYGAIGMMCLLALKWSALFYLPAPMLMAALLVAHPLSRLAASALIWRLAYARAEGKAKPLAQHMSHSEFLIAAATALLMMVIVGSAGWLSWRSLLLGCLASACATLWLCRMFVRRIGGYTGDCLGAVQQLSELAFYLAIVASMRA